LTQYIVKLTQLKKYNDIVDINNDNINNEKEMQKLINILRFYNCNLEKFVYCNKFQCAIREILFIYFLFFTKKVYN